MTNQPHSTVSSWDNYWQGTQDSSAFSDGGANHPAIQTYWLNFFHELAGNANESPIRILDLACGNGALLHLLAQSGNLEQCEVTCVDTSAAALNTIAQQFPQAKTILASADDTQLDSNTYDLIVSQFGIEYAGLEAIDEAIRLLSKDGRLRLLLHFKGGSIAGECTRNQHAINAFLASGFISAAKSLFETGYAAANGGERQPYDEAGKSLSKLLPEIEALIRTNANLAAADLMEKLYMDVGRIHTNLLKYDPQEVSAWLAQSEIECRAYLDRMQSMLDAALSEDEFHIVCRKLEHAGLTIKHVGPLLPHDSNRALAWVVSTE